MKAIEDGPATNNGERALLEPYRVIELCDGRGVFAGALLCQLGAEVVIVEPPAGGPTRSLPPFVDDTASAEDSVWHIGFNRGKRSVVLDWTTAEGARELNTLISGADVVLTSGSAAMHRKRGLPSLASLLERHPHIVIGNVSGFGLTGPKADWMDSDLICGAAGATLAMTGQWDRAPLRTSVPQVFLHASADAVVGVLIALAERAISGRGQIVDASAQESWVWAAGYAAYAAQWGEADGVRDGGAPRAGRFRVRFTYPASDGLVTITVLFGAAIGPYTDRLVRWMAEENECPEDIAEVDWAKFNAGKDAARYTRLQEAIAAFTSKRSQETLFEEGRKRRLLIAPILRIADVLAAEQFIARSSFCQAALPDGRIVSAPGTFVRANPPLPELGPAPQLGADTSRMMIRDKLGAASADADAVLPFSGLRVIDLTTSFAGPLVGRTLAAFGAQVVKVESGRRPDTARAAAPFRGKSSEGSLANAHTNAGKWSIALNLSEVSGREVLRDLVRWADVVIDASTPGAMTRLGFDDAILRDLNSSLVVLHTSMLGQTGPLAAVPGYGNMATALSGFVYTTGWPDREPVGPSGAYTDWISPRFGLLAVLAALDHRRRTGEGTLLDLGQGESALQLLTVGLVDRQLSSRTWERQGNRDYFAAPHSVFPTAGDDKWIAIACHTDEQWRALTEELGLDVEGLAALDLEARLCREGEIEALIVEQTSRLDGPRLQRQLQARRIAAHVVQNSSDCRADPQLLSRGGLVTTTTHAILGPVEVGIPPMRLSRTAPRIDNAGPTLGQHTSEVLLDILGYDDERITNLAIAGALE